MVYLTITAQGLKVASAFANADGNEIWCGSDAISEKEYENQIGYSLSRFNYSVHGSGDEVIEGALETIREHHPGHQIKVETINVDGALVFADA